MPGIGFMNYRRPTVAPAAGATSVYRPRPRARALKRLPYSKPVRKAMARVAKAVIRRQEEKKMAGNNIENAVAHNAQISLSDCYPVMPFITQGPGYNQRQGDKIRPQGIRVDGVVTFNDYGEGLIPVPLHVVVFVLQAKRNRDSSQITTLTPINSLLDGGLGAVAWDGSTLNSTYPINRDEFDILGARSFKLSDIIQENANCMSARYSMKVKTPALLHYTGAASLPNNFAPFVVLGWCRDDGVIPAITDTYVKHTCTSRVYYTDA